jgi:hypothetical protein
MTVDVEWVNKRLGISSGPFHFLSVKANDTGRQNKKSSASAEPATIYTCGLSINTCQLFRAPNRIRQLLVLRKYGFHTRLWISAWLATQVPGVHPLPFPPASSEKSSRRGINLQVQVGGPNFSAPTTFERLVEVQIKQFWWNR